MLKDRGKAHRMSGSLGKVLLNKESLWGLPNTVMLRDKSQEKTKELWISNSDPLVIMAEEVQHIYHRDSVLPTLQLLEQNYQ